MVLGWPRQSLHCPQARLMYLFALLHVGIVTNTRITHASPAGVYAKSANRDWESDADVKEAGFDTDRCPDIAHQLIHRHPGNKFKVIHIIKAR